MKINRLLVPQALKASENVEYEKRTSVIRNPDGSVVFEMNDIIIPKHWSQVATDIIAQKYFRKAGVPKFLKKVKEEGVPDWLCASEPDLDKLGKISEDERFTS